MPKQLSNIIKITSLTLAIALPVFLVTLTVSAAWTQPPGSPPNCPSGQPGCDTPVHVGSTTQAKSGALGVGGVFQTNSATYLAAANGNVGIGTTAPLVKLQVGSDGPTEQVIVGSSVPKLLVMGSKNDITDDSLIRLVRPTYPANLYPAAVDFKVKSFGTLGSPYHSKSQLTISLKDGPGYDVSSNTDVMSLRSNGNVGIGTTNPQAKLDVRNNAKFYDSAGNLVLIIE